MITSETMTLLLLYYSVRSHVKFSTALGVPTEILLFPQSIKIFQGLLRAKPTSIVYSQRFCMFQLAYTALTNLKYQCIKLGILCQSKIHWKIEECIFSINCFFFKKNIFWNFFSSSFGTFFGILEQFFREINFTKFFVKMISQKN